MIHKEAWNVSILLSKERNKYTLMAIDSSRAREREWRVFFRNTIVCVPFHRYILAWRQCYCWYFCCCCCCCFAITTIIIAIVRIFRSKHKRSIQIHTQHRDQTKLETIHTHTQTQTPTHLSRGKAVRTEATMWE